ncbi:biliverdin-producing heme oxygenase [Bernardetia sp. MNP-M8]|uniref:biliverdin-producing heme oxygenase n=1 Tax=Bernardetia sp. MNP-M8 TaxID=3127470 RepID=UPI0030CB95F5
MSILQTVRTVTRPRHDLMESLIGSDRLSNFSVEDYKLLLSTNYLFHSHLEHQSHFFLSLKDENQEEQIKKLDFLNRIKKDSLEIELRAMLPVAIFQELKQQENTIHFSSFENLLGWLYVAEGSMLGGKMIHRILAQNKEIPLVTNFDFFKNYEEKTSYLWKSFKELVEQACNSEQKKESFLEGAEKSYLYFEAAFYKAKNILQ